MRSLSKPEHRVSLGLRGWCTYSSTTVVRPLGEPTPDPDNSSVYVSILRHFQFSPPHNPPPFPVSLTAVSLGPPFPFFTWLSSRSTLASSLFRMNLCWNSVFFSSFMCSENLCSGLKCGKKGEKDLYVRRRAPRHSSLNSISSIQRIFGVRNPKKSPEGLKESLCVISSLPHHLFQRQHLCNLLLKCWSVCPPPFLSSRMAGGHHYMMPTLCV